MKILTGSFIIHSTKLMNPLLALRSSVSQNGHPITDEWRPKLEAGSKSERVLLPTLAYRVTNLDDKNPLSWFRQFWQQLGHYCSCSLPRQDAGTSQIYVNWIPSRIVTLCNPAKGRAPPPQQFLVKLHCGHSRNRAGKKREGRKEGERSPSAISRWNRNTNR